MFQVVAVCLVAMAYAADDCRGIYSSSNGLPAYAISECVGFDGAMSKYVCSDDYAWLFTYSGSDCSGDYTYTTIPSESTTGLYAVCDSDLYNCDAITLTGYIDSTTYASCDTRGTKFTTQYVSDCSNYTLGGATWSHQYVCESGCMLSKAWSNSDCRGYCETVTKVADSGILSCLSCDDSGNTCDDYTLPDTCEPEIYTTRDGAAQWMTTAVFALAGTLWAAM